MSPANRSSPGKLRLRSVGSFHIGGQRHTLAGLPVEQIRLAVGAPARTVDPNGSYVTGQMYVLRIPRHGGHDSTLMADSVPA